MSGYRDLKAKAMPLPITPTQLTALTIVCAFVLKISPLIILILFIPVKFKHPLPDKKHHFVKPTAVGINLLFTPSNPKHLPPTTVGIHLLFTPSNPKLIPPTAVGIHAKTYNLKSLPTVVGIFN